MVGLRKSNILEEWTLIMGGPVRRWTKKLRKSKRERALNFESTFKMGFSLLNWLQGSEKVTHQREDTAIGTSFSQSQKSHDCIAG
jgi:hypothetical protein